MNREEYLARLRKALSSLPASEVTDICGDFEEHFAIGLSQDKTEHEISAELGDPERVAGSYLGDAGEAVSTEDAVRAAANCAGNHGGASSANAAEQEKDLTGPRLFVILFNVLVMIWVAFAWLTTLFSLWCVTLAFLAAGIGLLIGLFAVSGIGISLLLLFGIGSLLLAVGSGILNFFLTKWSVIGTKAYIKWNSKVYNTGF